jgi:uncharacterized protein YqeY
VVLRENGVVEIGPGNVRERLRRALPGAMRARDAVAVAALRAGLAAIDNAEAVEAARHAPPVASHPELAGTLAGLGAGEVERRVLTDAQMEAIVRAEVTELRAAAEGYRRAGQADQAERLLAQAEVLDAHLDGSARGDGAPPAP